MGFGTDPNDITNDFADLPGGEHTVMAFWLAARPGGTSTGNSVTDNTLRAYCSSPCVGLGYFVSRGTGVDASGGWSASTTNYFTKNDPYGSNVGSKRCGANWYAASSTCTASTLDPDCNTDDPQHTGDWSRNDGCRDY